jgi:two-component system CheB/CheR fusion protein
MASVLRGETVSNWELRARRTDTNQQWYFSFSGQPVRDARGHQILAVVTTRDVTGTRIAEEALRRRARELDAARVAAEQARREAEAASHAKDQFLATLSHELRTPLTPVLAVAGILESDPRLPADVREDAAMIRRNVALETRLIDDLLDLTRISRGKVELDLRPVNVPEVLRQTIDICAADLSAKSLRLDLDADNCPSTVIADPARLHQIFWNLLKNAIKFTPEGGLINVRCAARGKRRVSVRISDTGIGIEPELLPRLFRPFEQGRQAVTRQYGGLGLGLAISKALVDLHRGRIRAQSAGRGKGATFTVELPLASDAPVSRPSAAQGDPSEADDQAVVRRHGGRSVLLVEDHADTAKLLARLLNTDGHVVHVADTMAAAVELLGNNRFDIVISDLGLPDGSGLDLISQARRINPLVRGIALSGYGTDTDRRQSRTAGFVEHLLKPVSLSALREAIDRAVRVDGPPPRDLT